MKVAHIDNYPCLITVTFYHWYYGSCFHTVCVEASYEEVMDENFENILCSTLWQEFNNLNTYSDMKVTIQHSTLPTIVVEWDINKQKEYNA